MSSMVDTAKQFFDACETGKGWEGCKPYCTPDASFAAQAGALADVKTLHAYTDWMKGMFTPFPDAAYEVKSFAADDQRQNVTAYVAGYVAPAELLGCELLTADKRLAIAPGPRCPIRALA